MRLLLDEGDGQFTRSLAWYPQSGSSIPDGVWSLLHHEGLVDGNVIGGVGWQLTVDGWIEACRLLRNEIGLDRRFGQLSAHLKKLGDRRTEAYTNTTALAEETGLSEQWIFDAIQGKMAERIFGQHGASVTEMGDVDIPTYIGNKLSMPDIAP